MVKETVLAIKTGWYVIERVYENAEGGITMEVRLTLYDRMQRVTITGEVSE